MEENNYRNVCELCGTPIGVAIYMDTEEANEPIRLCANCAEEWNSICEKEKHGNKEQKVTK